MQRHSRSRPGNELIQSSADDGKRGGARFLRDVAGSFAPSPFSTAGEMRIVATLRKKPDKETAPAADAPQHVFRPFEAIGSRSAVHHFSHIVVDYDISRSRALQMTQRTVLAAAVLAALSSGTNYV